MSLLEQDRDLLTRFRDGEHGALEQVYWAYVDKVESIVRFGFLLSGKQVRVGGVQPGSAEVADLVQDVFIKAFSRASRLAYDGLRPFGPYLFTIARNVLVDWGRRSGREIPMDAAELQSSLERTADGDDASYADVDTVRTVEGYIQGLPPDLRAVHDERYVRGRSQREAADALGISRQNLRTLEARLRDGLARELRRLEEGPGRVAPPRAPASEA
jgi:RNA polymerase sigma-70 factor (ECF subfamily)